MKLLRTLGSVRTVIQAPKVVEDASLDGRMVRDASVVNIPRPGLIFSAAPTCIASVDSRCGKAEEHLAAIFPTRQRPQEPTAADLDATSPLHVRSTRSW